MTTKRTSSIFAESTSEEEVVVTPAPTPDSGLRRARIKGTWTMYWGPKVFKFEDGKTYNIPSDLWNHLKNHGNIYDTL
jgi:hypothetical protein